MSIMEKNLPVAENINEGDKVRIITSEGNSKQIDASAFGGNQGNNIFHVWFGFDDYWYIDTSMGTIRENLRNGNIVIGDIDNTRLFVTYYNDNVIVFSGISLSQNGEPIINVYEVNGQDSISSYTYTLSNAN